MGDIDSLSILTVELPGRIIRRKVAFAVRKAVMGRSVNVWKMEVWNAMSGIRMRALEPIHDEFPRCESCD